MCKEGDIFAGLFDDIVLDNDASVKDIVSKIEAPAKETGEEVDKMLKSNKVTLFEKLAIIKERVLSVLGKRRSDVLVIKTKEELRDYVDKCLAAGRIAIDTETNNSTEPVTCKLMGLCLYAPGLKQTYIPVNHVDPETEERLSWQLTEEDLAEELRRIVFWRDTHADFLILMHNGKFDYEVICLKCGVRVKPDCDTIIGARLIDENKFSDKKTSLKSIFTEYCDRSQQKYSLEGLFENVPYAYVEPDIFALYAATDSFETDAVYLWELPFFDDPANAKVRWLFENIEMPIVEVTAKMEMRGVTIDEELGERLKAKYNQQLSDIDVEIGGYLSEIMPLVDEWKLSKWANKPAKIYASAKSKMSRAKLEETYPYTDLEDRRYKLGKAMVSQLSGSINLGSPTQLAVLFYDVLFRPEPNAKSPRGTGEDEVIALAKALEKDMENLDKIAFADASKFMDAERKAEAEAAETLSKNAEQQPFAIDLFGLAPAEEQRKPADMAELVELYKKALPAAYRMCSAIIERRGITKLISTYIDVIPDLAKHWPDGRIRFRLNSMGTDTGRYSSGGKWRFLDEDNQPVVISGINIQNIPSHNPEIRMLFKAKYEEGTTSFAERVPNVIPEITELETVNGFKFLKDVDPMKDLFLFADGSVCKQIAYINYKEKAKAYDVILPSGGGTVKTRTRYKIVGSDYSAQEPRLTAFVAQDEEMIKAYKEGKDLYAVIAQSAFDNNYEDNLEFYPEGTVIEVDGKQTVCGNKTHINKEGKARRKIGKVLQLAATYGMSGATAGSNMGKSKEEGEKLLGAFFKKFVGVKSTIEESKAFLKEHGYVEDWAGRRRRLPDINLVPYDATLYDQGGAQSNFNPFFGCEDREYVPEAVRIWRKILEAGVAKSQARQQMQANDDGDEWEGNDEMSNKEFAWLAKVALNPAKFKNAPRYPGKPKTNNAYIKEMSGYDVPDERVILIANTGRRAQAERQCFNARIQGGAASLTKLAMINIDRDPELRRLGAELIITVHDEVLVECPALYADEVEKRLPQIMIDTAAPYINVPMKCDPYNVNRWYADEAAVAVRDEFKKLELEDKMGRDEALAKECADHPEVPDFAIINAIENGADLEF